jgi:hypothetical protein
MGEHPDLLLNHTLMDCTSSDGAEVSLSYNIDGVQRW